MSYDSLLVYLSELGSGRWTQFKQAVSEVFHESERSEAAAIIRSLSALGHLEYSWQPSALWEVCPPTLVLLPRTSPPTGVLSGARSPQFLDGLRRSAKQFGVSVESRTYSLGPSVIIVQSQQLDVLELFADNVQLRWAAQAAEYLTICLPSLKEYVALFPSGVKPVVPPIEHFDLEQMKWADTTNDVIEGLYRFENIVPDYRLYQNGQWRRIDKEIGVYALLQKTVWKYDSQNQRLVIPQRLLPPPLYQRALVLCQGRLAYFDAPKGGWVYDGVPYIIATTLADKLGQSLENIC